MAEFRWLEVPPHGTCIICGSSVNERGFVDMIGDINVTVDGGNQITGIVDMIVCASCMEQGARLVGSATKQETMDFAYRELELRDELEKTKDEVKSWMQRYDQLHKIVLFDREEDEDAVQV